MLDLLNQNMCSTKCPCADSVKTAYDSVDAARFTYNGRQKASDSSAAAGRTQLVFGGKYTTFADCWTDSLLASTAKDTASAMQGYLPVMKKFEPKFSCSAMCKPGLFWFT